MSIKIKIADIERHRNETTFRPYLLASDYFRECGIQFITSGNSYDFLWIGQASYSNKSLPLQESIDRGLEYLDKITGDYWLFDGQDSASLIGTYDIFLKSSAQFLLKNTLYREKSEYSLPYINGRNYWGMRRDGWSIRDWSRFDDVVLSGTNWLSTVVPNWFSYSKAEKEIDVFAIFQYPAKENFEFMLRTSEEYDAHRERCINELKTLPRSVRVAMLDSQTRIPPQEYYNLMSKSKIVIAPFGYGEMAPRDIESAMVGSILIKPNMNHLSSIPWVYIPEHTYVSVDWDFSNLRLQISEILENWKSNQAWFVEHMRRTYSEQYSTEKLITYIHNLLQKTPNVEVE